MKGIADFEKSLFELIRRTATDLPADVEASLVKALAKEKKGSHAYWVLSTLLENAQLARQNDAPICQDSGTLVFSFRVPVGFDTNALVARTRAAVSKATRRGYLRENTLDSLTGASYETNIAHGSPVIRFSQGARQLIDVSLLMKGGGCENTGCQYSLPDQTINAERDMEGVRRCVLDAVQKAQGKGCAPSVLGVCIGGDRTTGYEHSKDQFFRKLDDKSPVKALARIERKLLKDANSLGIGPMGLGGGSTVLAVKMGSLCRVPASFYVTVSFMCCAFRRRGAALAPDGAIRRWLYR
jgi:fumarate hydratase class I